MNREWFAAYLPAKTLPATVGRLRDLIVNATKSAPAQTFFKNTGIEPWDDDFGGSRQVSGVGVGQMGQGDQGRWDTTTVTNDGDD